MMKDNKAITIEELRASFYEVVAILFHEWSLGLGEDGDTQERVMNETGELDKAIDKFEVAVSWIDWKIKKEEN